MNIQQNGVICVFCLEIGTEGSHSLGCGHSCCPSCISDMARCTDVECPTCIKTVKVLSAELSEKVSHTAEACDNTMYGICCRCQEKSDVFCVFCQLPLCKHHLQEDQRDAHADGKPHHYHVPIESFLLNTELYLKHYCKQHKQSETSKACSECLQSFCSSCSTNQGCKNGRHVIQAITEVSESTQSRVEELIKLLSEKMMKLSKLGKDVIADMEKVNAEALQMQEEVDSVVNEQMKCISQMGEGIKAEISKFANHYNSQSDVKTNQVKSLEEQANSYLGKLIKVQHMVSPGRILEKFSLMKEKLDWLLKENISLVKAPKAHLVKKEEHITSWSLDFVVTGIRAGNILSPAAFPSVRFYPSGRKGGSIYILVVLTSYSFNTRPLDNYRESLSRKGLSLHEKNSGAAVRIKKTIEEWEGSPAKSAIVIEVAKSPNQEDLIKCFDGIVLEDIAIETHVELLGKVTLTMDNFEAVHFAFGGYDHLGKELRDYRGVKYCIINQRWVLEGLFAQVMSAKEKIEEMLEKSSMSLADMGSLPSVQALPTSDKLNFTVALDNVTVKVYQGDITRVSCNAIVNAAYRDLVHADGVAKEICAASDPGFQKESKDFVRRLGHPLYDGEIFTQRSTGRLRQSGIMFVINAVAPIYRNYRNDDYQCENILNQAIFASIKEAERRNCKSIAIPALGSGVPIEICAAAYWKGVLRFIHEERGNLKEVHFAINDHKTTKAIVKAFKKFHATNERGRRWHKATG